MFTWEKQRQEQRERRVVEVRGEVEEYEDQLRPDRDLRLAVRRQAAPLLVRNLRVRVQRRRCSGGSHEWNKARGLTLF